MKITILSGSPRKNGNSVYMAGQFIKGAQEAGHEVFFFDCAKHRVNGCLACNHCNMDGPCVQNDDFEIVRPHIVEADMIVFVTPLYYFGLSAQLKAVVDRFYAIHNRLQGKKCVLMVSMGNTSDKVAEPTVAFYKAMTDYLEWEDCGKVLASGVWFAEDIQKTDFGRKAYELGKKLK